MSRFSLNRGSGFHLTFDNNWTVSVQFGGGHYCDNYTKKWNFGMEQASKGESVRSSNAEIAVWSNRIGDSDLIWLENDTVRGYTTANEVAQVINKVSTAKSTLTSKQMTKRLSTIWK
jgi:hypothetical protein